MQPISEIGCMTFRHSPKHPKGESSRSMTHFLNNLLRQPNSLLQAIHMPNRSRRGLQLSLPGPGEIVHWMASGCAKKTHETGWEATLCGISQ
jgi:hypothetical protein